MVNPKMSDSLDKELRALIDRTLSKYGIAKVSISPALDHDGDPVIAITIAYAPSGPRIDPSVLAELPYAVRALLVERDEDRFPHIYHQIGEERDLPGAA